MCHLEAKISRIPVNRFQSCVSFTNTDNIAFQFSLCLSLCLSVSLSTHSTYIHFFHFVLLLADIPLTKKKKKKWSGTGFPWFPPYFATAAIVHVKQGRQRAPTCPSGLRYYRSFRHVIIIRLGCSCQENIHKSVPRSR